MVISLCIPLFIGMLPLPGSSTFDLEEELEELFKKLLIIIMEGEGIYNQLIVCWFDLLFCRY